MKRLVLLVLVVSWPTVAVAQQNVNATYTDASTGARVNVGNSVARSIRAAIVDATGNPFGTLANPIRIDPTGTSTQPVSGVGNFTAVQPTGSAFHMTCDSGCSASPGFSDNSAFTYGVTAINPIGGVLDDVSTSLATENSAAIARITSRKALHVNLRDNSGNELGVSAAPVQVSLANTGANATAITATGNKTNNNASPGATNVGTLPALANATAPGWTEGNLVANSVDLHGSMRTTLLTAAGAAATLAQDATVAATASTTGPQLLVNAVTADPTAVTTGQAQYAIGDLSGKLVTSPYAISDLLVSGVTAAMTSTTTTSIIAAPAAGLRNYVTQITCTNSHATVGTFVVVQDGSGGTTIYEAYAAAVGGGFALTFPAPLRQPTTATALFVADVTTGANVICAASGYKGR